ncbi:MAG TPA: hypothetical protein EYN06_02040, partial [Myxococcales bacterium]|nr:hypothetical protein [Myxococcales bacterium]
VQPHAVQEAVDNELVGTWKRDPMQGGGTGDQEQGFLFRMFSDYSVFKMREWLEGYLLKWNAFYFRYAAWNKESGDYDEVVDKDEVNLPIKNKVQVYSLLVNISGVSTEANYIYPIIGPYESGLIRKFDPTIKADREAAATIFCPEDGCDLTLRVVQGGVTKHFMLNAPWLADANPFTTEGFFVRAVNLAVEDGTVSTAELLLTPDAQDEGLPDGTTVLYSYEYHDCNNVLGGAALIDQCGDCTGGDTGKQVNAGCCTPGGKITLETWTDMKGKIADIPLIQAPDEKESLTRWNKKWQKKDHIGTRVRALLCVPETDVYQFAIASDDNGELWLSDDESPINKEMVAWVQHWTPYQVFDDEATQISLDIPLEGGKKYYMESLHQQGGGGVHLTVSWAKVGDDLQIIKGSQTVPVKVETLD